MNGIRIAGGRAFALVMLLLATSQLSLATTTPPSGLTVFRDSGPGNGVTLRWFAPIGGGPYTYNIYRAVTLSAIDISTLTPIASNWPLLTVGASLGPSPTYFYTVTAVEGGIESVAVDTVGYTTINALGGAGAVYTPFGLAFYNWDVPTGGAPTYNTPSSKPSDVFADQLMNCGTILTSDRIVDMNNGQFAFRNAPQGCAWVGTLETGAGMIYGHGFWYLNRTGVTRDVLVCGQIRRGPSYYIAVFPAGGAVPFQTPYAWRDAMVLGPDQLELLQGGSGFQGGTTPATSDILWSLGPVCPACYAWYNTTSSQFDPTSTLTQIVPGQAYRILNRHAAWTYNYQFAGTP